ncbi:MAG: glycosyltransferase [Bacteroidales bacterium]|nr:glycosyltransferase [Bacteroidales bacterium]
MIVLIILSAVIGLYAVLIGALIIGWLNLPIIPNEGNVPVTKVSVIIAARNEEHHIHNILSDLERLAYPRQLLEIIIVDDHSDDDTGRKVEDFILFSKAGFTLMRNDSIGKKAAIEAGVRAAKGELILTTDADCHIGEYWVNTIVNFYENKHSEMILSPVNFKRGKNLFEMMQELEFMSLQFSTAGAVSIGKPMMANGANLAYRREAFLEVGGFEGNNHLPSGDDVFLMQAFSKRFGPKMVNYLSDRQAMVSTSPETTLKGLISQRLRWVSKTRGIKSPAILIPAVIVYFINLAIVSSMLLAPFFSQAIFTFLLCILGKTLIDLPALWLVTGFFNRKKLLWFVPLLELVNAIYTVLIGIFGNLASFNWKGRILQTRNS